MSLDSDGAVSRAEDPGIRSFLGEDWVVTIRFYVGVGLLLLGLLLTASGVLFGWEIRATSALSTSAISVGAVVFLAGAFTLWDCRLSERQRQYLTRSDQERAEIRSYLSFLDDVEAEHDREERGIPWSSRADPESNDEEGSSAEQEVSGGWSGPLRELRSRFRLALDTLDRAERAVYRRNYASFFSLYYDASRQEILLYDLLDEYAGGWTFGLGVDGAAGNELEREVSAGPEPHRRRNLSRRIRSYAEGTLPEDQLVLVEEYLGPPETLPTPWQLYYAVRVLHEWNVSQYESALNVRRFLRRFTVALIFVLVGLVAVVVLAFSPDGFLKAANATSSAATALPANSVVLRDSFLALVVLTGALGAIVSVIRGFDWEGFTTTTDPTVTEPTQMAEGFLARIVFGSVSALFLFVLARSELGAVVLAENLLKSPLALLLIAFVAGFSENLILQLLSDIVNRISPRESETDAAVQPARNDLDTDHDAVPPEEREGRSAEGEEPGQETEGDEPGAGTDGDESGENRP